MDDIDLWRAARVLIDQRDDAELFAAGRVDDMIAAGDPSGEATWKLILKAIRDLKGLELRAGERLN